MTEGKQPQIDNWFAELRVRFVGLARRRVPEDLVEDLVQEAMGIVFEKGFQPGDEVQDMPGLAWCFQVLRNVIGNYYQKQKTRSREAPLEEVAEISSGLTPVEALSRDEQISAVNTALDTLASGDSKCGQYLRRLLDGQSPASLAEEEGVTAAVLYRRVYRCRTKLRSLLEASGVAT